MGANPNTMDIKAVWDSVYQITHTKQPTYKVFADERLAGKLEKGDTVHRTYSSDGVVNDMGADGSYSTQALADTDETIIVNKVKEYSFYIKELDELQAQLPVRVKYARKAMNRLFLQIDADVLGTAYQQATSVVDDGSLGGTSGNGITVGVGNIANVFAAALQALQLQNIIFDPNARFTGDVKQDLTRVVPAAAISPQVYNQLLLFVGGKNSAFGDKVSRNGHAGMFFGFNLFVSNNIGWSGSLALATQPTDGDTATANGVTFTFKTVLGATPGNVLIGGSAAAAQTNLIALLNAPGTTTANGVALSTANQNLLKNLTASQGTNAVTVIMLGYGTVVVSQSMTAAGNIWTAAKQVQHNLFGVNNSISLIIQKRPTYKINPVTGKVGSDFVTWTAYGIKVFNDQKPMLVDVQVNSSSFTAPSNTFN